MNPSLLFSIILSLVFVQPAFSQEGHGSGNGGDISQATLKVYINRIIDLMQTQAGSTQFKASFDIQTFVTSANQAIPLIVSEPLTDRFGNTVSCLNSADTHEIRCNHERVNSEYKSGPALYVTLFHELLNQIQVELPIDGHSHYEISSQIEKFVRLIVQKDWILSNETLPLSFNFKEGGLYCSNGYFTDTKKDILIIHPNGNYWFVRYQEPRYSDEEMRYLHGPVQFGWARGAYDQLIQEGKTKEEMNALFRKGEASDKRWRAYQDAKLKIKGWFGSRPRLTILSMGNIQSSPSQEADLAIKGYSIEQQLWRKGHDEQVPVSGFELTGYNSSYELYQKNREEFRTDIRYGDLTIPANIYRDPADEKYYAFAKQGSFNCHFGSNMDSGRYVQLPEKMKALLVEQTKNSSLPFSQP